MSEALALVRRELGPDAAVLHTREVQKRRLFGLFSGSRMIEVTASRGVNVPSRLKAKEHAETASAKNIGVADIRPASCVRIAGSS